VGVSSEEGRSKWGLRFSSEKAVQDNKIRRANAEMNMVGNLIPKCAAMSAWVADIVAEAELSAAAVTDAPEV
jgi:hypothetical protein